MAEYIRYTCSFGLIDGVKRSCGNTFYISQADAQEYFNAADDAERAASAVGVLAAKYLGMTDALDHSINVGMEVLTEPVGTIADTVLRGNKLQFNHTHGGRGGVFNVPARKAASFSQQADSLTVSITTPTAMSDFVTAVNATVLDADGNAVTVSGASIVD